MKKAVFIEMEGVLIPFNDFVPIEKKTERFVENLCEYCKKNKIELFLISGYHKDVAVQKFSHSFLKKHFLENQLKFVQEEYIENKQEADKELHLKKLENDPEFNDSYFKQVFMKKFIEKNNLLPEDVLLLSDDVWVDGFYTIKFSGVDFAIFEENITERGNKTERIPGLVYFNLDFESVKVLINDFPEMDTSNLEKFVFKKMSEVLMKDVDLSGLVKKANEKIINEGGV
jgi:hypothetical protein